MRSVYRKEGLNKFQLLIQLRGSVAQTLRTEQILFALLPLDHDNRNVIRTESNGKKKRGGYREIERKGNKRP